MSYSKYDILNIQIPSKTIALWQNMANLLGEIVNVPAALIMCVHEKEIEVFIKSDDEKNVYKQGEHAFLDTGLYCETVMDTKEVLHVPNALKDKAWENNPDVPLGMISYLGLPIQWPNGKIFGTICVLDNKEKHFSQKDMAILKQFQSVIESSLENIFNNELLNNQMQFQKTLLQNSPIPIYHKNLEGKYVNANNAMSEMLQIPIYNILGKTIYDIVPKEKADEYTLMDNKVFTLEENPQIFETSFFNKTTNEKRDLIFYKSAYLDDSGKVVGLIGTILDVTNQNLLKNKLEVSKQKELQSKMASLGEMLGNIAHQWRQPLSYIVTTATGVQLQQEYGVLEEKFLNDSVNKINSTAQHMSKTLEIFTDYISDKHEAKTTLSIQNEIKKALEIVKGTLTQNHITIVQEHEKQIEYFMQTHTLIQVLVDIINNAKDALKNYSLAEKKLIFIRSSIVENSVQISIQDNAGGVDESIIEKIFEPYFTTKSEFESTGLGLHTVYQLVKRNLNGNIEVTNEGFSYEGCRYQGAKFIIELPLNPS